MAATADVDEDLRRAALLGGMNPWVPTALIMTGTVMVVLNMTVVNIALRPISVDLGGDGIEWVVSAYLLAVCVSQPLTGWLADRFGRKRHYLNALALFTAGSVLSALAPNLPVLIAARALQGLGGGAVMPIGMAMVLDIFPPSRHGRAIATWGTTMMVGPAVGPTLGGWLVSSVGWHWIFLANVPLGLVCLALGPRLLPDSGLRQRRPFDFLGLLLGCGGLAVFILGVSEADRWGWRSPTTIVCIASGVGALALFVRHALRTPTPMIQLRLLSNRPFRLAMLAMIFMMVGQFGRMIFVSLELQTLRGYSALRVGLLFLPGAIVTAVVMQVGGRLSDRVGPRLPILLGTTAAFGGLVGLGNLQLDTPSWVIAGIFCVQGVGFGLANAPALVAGISELPSHMLTHGTALRSLCSQVASALAVATLGAIVSGRMGEHASRQHALDAYNSAFRVGALCAGIAFLIAWRLPSGRADAEVVEGAPVIEPAAGLAFAD